MTWGTVRGADSINVIDEGAVVESGTHDQLVQYDELCRKPFSIQGDDRQGVGPGVEDEGTHSRTTKTVQR